MLCPFHNHFEQINTSNGSWSEKWSSQTNYPDLNDLLMLGYKSVQLTVFAWHTFIHEMSKNINRAEAVMPEKKKRKSSNCSRRMCRSYSQLLEALGYCCLGEVSQLLIPRIHFLFHFQSWTILWNKGLTMNLLWRKSIWRWLSLDSEDIINSPGAESHMWRLQRQEMVRDPLEQKDKCVSHSLLHLNSCFGWRTSTAAHISPLQLCSKATLHICISE